MTEFQARQLVQQYSFLHLSAEPDTKLGGWRIRAYCRDGESRFASNAKDFALLYRSTLIRVK